MKYLKQYDEFNEGIVSNFKKSFNMSMNLWEWFIEYGKSSPNNLFINDKIQGSPEDYEKLNCAYSKIKNLKGIKNFINLEKLECERNEINYLDGIENCKNLKWLLCYKNKLKSLRGIENLKNLEVISCHNNKLKNLNEIKFLPNLETLLTYGNPFEEPVPIEIVNKFGFNDIYGAICNHNHIKTKTKKGWECSECGEIIVDIKTLKTASINCVDKFKSYEFQKRFLTKHPEKVLDLKPLGFHDKIKEEFPSLIRGTEWGFFDLERSGK